MKASTFFSITAYLGAGVAAPAPVDVVSARDDISVAAVTVQLCGGSNWSACNDYWIGDNQAFPLNTFGSYNTRGHTCHCGNANGDIWSNPFSGENGNILGTWGDYWFYNCRVVGCW